MKALTGGTMAILAGKRPLAAELVLYLAAVATNSPSDDKVVPLVDVFVDAVWRAGFPLVLGAMRTRSGLMLVGRLLGVAIAVGARLRRGVICFRVFRPMLVRRVVHGALLRCHDVRCCDADCTPQGFFILVLCCIRGNVAFSMLNLVFWMRNERES
jgi:hypothetical protein